MSTPLPGSPESITADPQSITRTGEPTSLWIRLIRIASVLTAIVAGTWVLIGERTWRDLRDMRNAELSAEDSAPIGYVGLYYRKHYAAHAPRFVFEENGKKLLFASLGDEPNDPTRFYDVGSANFDLTKLSGGVGSDSVPGVDYPLFESRNGIIGKNFRPKHEMFAVVTKVGPRAYPRHVLQKVDVVNDSAGDDHFVLIFDHRKSVPVGYSREIEGEVVTFGTTGYGYGTRVLAYDRATRSLWESDDEKMTCVNGFHAGKVLPRTLTLTATTWGDWLYRNPESVVLIGSDRSLPIPDK